MRRIHRDIVGIVIVSRDGKIFMVKSNPDYHGSYEGYWVIPGGGIEKGETPEESVIREAKEETGIDLSGYGVELVAKDRKGQTEKTLKDSGERVLVDMDFAEFKSEMSDKDAKDISVTLSEEHSEYGWFKPGELKALKISPPSLGLFKQLGYI